MRDYPVPFSTREEAPFLFNCTLRELMWIGGSVMGGFVFSILLFLVVSAAHSKYAFTCFFLVIPVALAGFYFGKKRYEIGDNSLTTDRKIILNFKYRHRPHKYYNRRS